MTIAYATEIESSAINASRTRVSAALLALGLGLVMIFAAGFAPQEIVHNAAHDARHAFAFPCH